MKKLWILLPIVILLSMAVYAENNITASFTQYIKTLSQTTYGVTSGTNIYTYLGNGTSNNADFNDDGALDGVVNRTWHKERLLDAKVNLIRMSIDINSAYSNTSDASGVNFTASYNSYAEVVRWADENDFKVVLLLNYIPTWLANSSAWCDKDNRTCPPYDYTRLGNIINDSIYRITSKFTYLDAIDSLEIKNEPYAVSGTWLYNLAHDNNTKADEYIKFYNNTYYAVKAQIPSLAMGGPDCYWGFGSFQGAPTMCNSFLGNISNNEVIFIHSYPTSNDTGYLTHRLRDRDLGQTLGNCTIANCSRIIFSEWNLKDSTIQNDSTNITEYNANIAMAYVDGLNYPGVDVSYIGYQWQEEYAYSNVANYPGYPDKYSWVSEIGLDSDTQHTYYPPYNVTKSFATYCPSGSTVYSSSSDDNSIKSLTCRHSNYGIIIINTNSSSKNVSINVAGTGITNLRDINNIYPARAGYVNIGILNANEIVYLTDYTEDLSKTELGSTMLRIIAGFIGLLVLFIAIGGFVAHIKNNFTSLTPQDVLTLGITILICVILSRVLLDYIWSAI